MYLRSKDLRKNSKCILEIKTRKILTPINRVTTTVSLNILLYGSYAGSILTHSGFKQLIGPEFIKMQKLLLHKFLWSFL